MWKEKWLKQHKIYFLSAEFDNVLLLYLSYRFYSKNCLLWIV